MNYDDFKNSILTNPNPFRSIPVSPTSNIYGRYWESISKVIFGFDDARARSGTFTTPWDAPSSRLFVPPTLIYIPDTLSDLLDQRAIELNNTAKESNKRIIILWSGGIDSTSVVSAFIKNLAPQDLKNILICCTASSIMENIYFYQKYIVPNFACIHYTTLDITNEFLSSNMVLHGDPGDCLYGPSLLMYEQLLSDKLHLKPWKDNLYSIATNIDHKAKQIHGIPDGFAQWYADKITNNLLEVQPLGVDTVSDWWWWHYYNFKWEFSIWRPLFKMRKNVQQPLNKNSIESYVTNTFMNTDKFQLWSYSNLKTHVGTSKQDHKKQAKQYIFELDHNAHYFDFKIKVNSSPDYWLNKIRPVYYDQDWGAHYLNEPGVAETATELLENFKG